MSVSASKLFLVLIWIASIKKLLIHTIELFEIV